MTNLQGIPYEVRFLGEGARPPRMSMHGDHLHFALGRSPGLRPEIRPLPPGRYDDPQWGVLAQSALATGAFPVGLAPREISRTMKEYADREWPIPGPVEEGGRVVRCGQFRSIPPDFPSSIRDDPDAELKFLCIDGGVVDNEPLSLARRILDGDRYFAPQTRGDRVDRALIAIAPFPDLPTFTVPPPGTGPPFLLNVLAGALAGVVNEARFDPKFAIEERDPEAFHRFMIAPKRDVPPPAARTLAHLAGSSVGGFGGFLCEDFRAHDFQLGRRNCQQFLSTAFALPDEEANRNPLFATGWTEAARDHYRIVEGPDGLERPRGRAPGVGDKVYLPIIPLWGTAAEEVPLMDWPRYEPGQFETLRGQFAKRLDAVIRRFIDRNFHNPFRRLALRGARRFLVRRVAQSLVRTMAEDLGARGLIR